jgi:uncharacterized protein YneF (UPF0154 family)
MKKTKSKKLLPILIIVLLVILSLTTIYFYQKYQNAKKLLSNPTQVNKEEVKSLLAKVGKLIDLPKEEPTVATVTDKEKLKDQAFFANAKNGDKVIIYMKAKTAILYDPVSNKIRSVSPLNIIPQASTSGQITK